MDTDSAVIKQVIYIFNDISRVWILDIAFIILIVNITIHPVIERSNSIAGGVLIGSRDAFTYLIGPIYSQ
ncbi:MAG: hypothetical protein JXN64_01265 [Spirochaetes bacterium]|nr:hypothetical protein [Spirochaetota bacterium]